MKLFLKPPPDIGTFTALLLGFLSTGALAQVARTPQAAIADVSVAAREKDMLLRINRVTGADPDQSSLDDPQRLSRIRQLGSAVGGADRSPWSTLIALHVHPLWHEQGIGSALLTALRQLAVDRSRPHMQLSVLKANTGARRFYERRGFRERGTAPIHTIGGQRVAVLRYVLAPDAAQPVRCRQR